MTYQLTTGDTIKRLADNAFIPPDPANGDYRAYLAWLAEGNTPEPADQPDPKDAIKAQIAAIEATITPRRLREALISGNSDFILAVDAEIALLRAQL